MSRFNVNTVLGTNQFGTRALQEESKQMIELFQSHGHNEVDCAFIYGEGKAEETIGKITKTDFSISTKAFSWEDQSLQPSVVRYQLEKSLQRLQRTCVDIFYLHAPDYNTPLINTLREVNNLKFEGKFKEFGICNYPAWQVAEIVNICQENGWVKPTVYQAGYSALTRIVEKELIPCLRYYNIRFYSYSPLMGGLLTGKHELHYVDKKEEGRFFGEGKLAKFYRKRFWKKDFFDTMSNIKKSLLIAYGNKISIAEASLRWLYNHSMLDGRFGDAVIVGSASMRQLSSNLEYIKGGPLDESVVKAFDEAWKITASICPDYV